MLLTKYVARVKIDRILDEQDEHENHEGTTLRYLVKWESLPYSEATWESADLINVQTPPANNTPIFFILCL